MIGMSALINHNFQQGLQEYLNQEEVAKTKLLAERLVKYYSEENGWQQVTESPHVWANLLRQIGELPPPPRRDRPRRDRPQQEPENLQQNNSDFITPLSIRLSLLTNNGQYLIESAIQNEPHSNHSFVHKKIPVMLQNKQIATLDLLQNTQISNKLAKAFLYSQSKNTFTITLATLLLTLFVAFVLVKILLKPLKALHKASDAVQKGNLETQVNSYGNDEVSDLIQSFNQLVSTLKQQKIIRDQWLSDISHELRTPLAVLKSEIEALQDGIRPMNPKYIGSLHRQVENLTNLVEDLYALSLSDTDTHLVEQNHPVDIREILNSVGESYALRLSQKQISIDLTEISAHPVSLKINAKNLQQLFSNLLENSYRYTNKGGLVKVSLLESDHNVIIKIEDSAPGVSDEELPKLFQRLYRVDKSRSRVNGGSGLGLSICQKIVTAHSGTIHAEHSKLGGIKVIITLPKNP
ncbi:ATP-binding protein [Thiomicrorhabdus hydrogeniphila]